MSNLPVIHVVFTRDTFRLLRLGVYSLQAHSKMRFRIVCNGLQQAEVAEVAAFCESFSRLDYVDFPSAGRMLPHGTLLELLLRRTEGNLFGFVDSDVFALGPFEDEANKLLAQADILSLADHPVQEGKPQHVGTGGGSTVSPSGLQLANTFFAVYRRQAILDLMRETGVSLERYQRVSQIPPAIQATLPPADLGQGIFDTAKLMCALASSRGLRVMHKPLENLFHMGRMSVPSLGDSETLPPRLRSKRQLRAFFGRFMTALDVGDSEPILSFDDPAVNQLLQRVCPQLELSHRQMLQQIQHHGGNTGEQADPC